MAIYDCIMLSITVQGRDGSISHLDGPVSLDHVQGLVRIFVNASSL